MKIKSLKFGAQRFTVVGYNPNDEEITEAEGWTNASNLQIGVSSKYNGARWAEILIHEIMHAILWEAGLSWNDENAELWIRRVSPRVAAFFADNPKEIKALVALLANEAKS